MIPSIRLILLAIVLLLAGIDTAWQQAMHYYVDMASVAGLLYASFLFLLAGLFYTYVRMDRLLSAMLLGLSFMPAFATACTYFTYFALSIAGTRIDDFLAAVDRGLGVDWPSWTAFVANHSLVRSALSSTYLSSMAQPPLLALWLGWFGPAQRIEKMCLAMAISGVATALIWTAFPSFGAVTIYWIPDDISARLGATVGNEYGHELLRLLADGPSTVYPLTGKGLIGFPSYHVAVSVFAVWYSRADKRLFFPLLLFNIAAVAGAPFIGGHHVIDLIGGGVVAVASIWLAGVIYEHAAGHDARAAEAGPLEPAAG